MLHDYLKASEKIALVCGGQRLSYREIDERSNALANSLAAAGVERGDRVIVFADNTVETVISFWAVLKANAVVSIVNPLTKSDKLAYLLNDSRSSCLITTQALRGVWEQALARNPNVGTCLVSGLRPDANAKLESYEKAVGVHAGNARPTPLIDQVRKSSGWVAARATMLANGR